MSNKKFTYFGDDQPGTYPVFEGILVPQIEFAAANDSQYLHELMNFVERVAGPGVGSCNDLVQIGLGEWLSSSANAEIIRAAAGPHTIRAIQRAERYFNQAARDANWSPLLSLFRRLTLPRRKKPKC